MKERPILFSAPMVRALIKGTKTQTRRIEIVSVRCERLHDISEADAKAEGVMPAREDHTAAAIGYIFGAKEFMAQKSAYATLWESINGSGSWALNPWVWVVEFRRVQQ